MTIDKRLLIIAIFLIVLITTIYYIVSKTMLADKNTALYVDVDVDEHLVDNVIVNVELIRNSQEYSQYIEKKLINIDIKNKNMPIKISLENSLTFKFFINYDNTYFYSMSKDQIYYPFDTDVKNRFEIKEIDNQFYLKDYGLYKINDKSDTNFDTYLLEEGHLSNFVDYEQYTNTRSDPKFIIQPLEKDSINFFSTLTQSELSEYKFIPSDKKTIDELRTKKPQK